MPIKPVDIRPRYSVRGGAVLLPPESSWPALDEIREKHDPQIVRWMPHVRLVFPFVAPEEFDAALEVLRAVCARVAPFQAVLSTVRDAPLSSGKGALLVPVEPAEPVLELQSRLREAFPQVAPKRASDLPPHVPVGQTRTSLIAERVAEELAVAWEPIRVTFGAVHLVGRVGGEPMHAVHEVPLGG